MPRAILTQSTQANRCRTVSSVADELGVSASTLRTWERRYGLGPTGRQAGARRPSSPPSARRNVPTSARGTCQRRPAANGRPRRRLPAP